MRKEIDKAVSWTWYRYGQKNIEKDKFTFNMAMTEIAKDSRKFFNVVVTDIKTRIAMKGLTTWS